MQENVLKVKDVAEICQVCPKTIYREIKRGYLPATIIGKEYRILESDLKEYLDKNCVNRTEFINQVKKEKKIKISLTIEPQIKRELDELNANKYFGIPLSIMVNKLLDRAIKQENISNFHKQIAGRS